VLESILPSPSLPSPLTSSSLPSPLPSPLHSPSLPIPLEVGPLNPARESGGVLKAPPSGSGAEPQPKSNLVHCSLKNLTCGGNNLNNIYFPKNQLTQFLMQHVRYNPHPLSQKISHRFCTIHMDDPWRLEGVRTPGPPPPASYATEPTNSQYDVQYLWC